MQGITRVAVLALLVGGCFPPLDDEGLSQGDVADSSGLDTAEGGDTSPRPDTAPGEDTIEPVDTVADTEDTSLVDTEDTSLADTGDTAVADSEDTAEVDTGNPECEDAGDCSHLAGVCTKVVCLDGTCAAQPDTGADCDDGAACTKDDVCSGFTCAGTAYACDDGEACTDDVCDGGGGCDYPAKAGACWIAGQCHTVGDTKPGDPCRVCQGGETWSPNDGATCDDGDDVCTLGDTCDGTTCVGGGPPDDGPGNWAENVVLSVSPQRSFVDAIHPIGVNDWALVTTLLNGGQVQATTGDISFSGSTVAVVRKAPASLWLQGSFTGATAARLTASTSSNGAVAVAAELEGVGAVDFGDVHLSKSDTEATSYIFRSDDLGDRRFVIDAIGSPDALAIVNDGGLVQAYTTADIYLTHAGEAASVAAGDQSNTAVVAYDYSGSLVWGGIVRTPGFGPGPATLCRVSGDEVALVAPFRGAATIEIGASSVEATGVNGLTTFLVARFDGAGETRVFTPVQFLAEIQVGAAAVRAPTIHCDSSGFTLVLDSAGGTITTLEADSATVGADGGEGILRFAWDGTLQWGVNLTHGYVLGSAYQGGESVLVVVSIGEQPALTSVDGSTGLQLGTGSRWILGVRDGLPTLVVAMPPSGTGLLNVVGLRSASGHARIAFGGSFVGQALDWTTASPGYSWTGSSDFNAFAGLLNSAGALTCPP